jgi:acyl-coenzyme A synthetase/AMP-(fatty) acid ligase
MCMISSQTMYFFNLVTLVIFVPKRFEVLEKWNIDFNEPRFQQDSNYTTTVRPQTTFGVWEGWGTSLCWWANVFGQNENLADLFFTMKHTRIKTPKGLIWLPGLGLNIARYNAGGNAWKPLTDGSTMVTSPNIPAFKQMEGFWQDNDSSDPSSSSFDWSVDQNQIAMLKMAQARGCDYLELFSNSPMWWQLENSNPSGGAFGFTVSSY